MHPSPSLRTSPIPCTPHLHPNSNPPLLPSPAHNTSALFSTRRAQEALQWHGVAEQLATEHRDSALYAALDHTRTARLWQAVAAWRLAASSLLHLPTAPPPAIAGSRDHLGRPSPSQRIRESMPEESMIPPTKYSAFSGEPGAASME